VPYQLAQVVRFISVTEEPSEHTSTRAAEEDGRRVKSKRGCSQDGDKRTQNGDARSTIRMRPAKCALY
jgi:hypothetical protein